MDKGVAEASLAPLVVWFEALTPATLADLARHYHPEVRFKDPFNDVTGHAAVARIFGHMFEALQAPRFTVRSRMAAGDEAFLTWDFDFGLRGRALCIRGATHLRFADDGRVLLHRDYWDPAEEIYTKLPVLGPLVRWLTRRLAG